VKSEMMKTLTSMMMKRKTFSSKLLSLVYIWSKLIYSPIKRSASTMSLSQNAHHRQSGSDDYTSRSGLIPPRMGMMRRHTTSAALSPPTPPPFMRVSELPNFPLWEEVACLAHPENDLRTFWQGFEQHHQGLLEFIDHLDFDGLEQSVCFHIWCEAWS
jgi:hypothetical protein